MQKQSYKIQYACMKVVSGHLRKKRRQIHHLKDELNRLINGLLHPPFDRSPSFIIADDVFHGLVERIPPETAVRFMHYSVPKIIEEIVGAKA